MLDELFDLIGYSHDEILFITNSYPISAYSKSTLYYNFKKIISYLRSNAFSNDDIKKMTCLTPQLITVSVENYKIIINELLTIGFNKIEAFDILKRYPYIIIMNLQRIKKVFNLFSDLGFSMNNIKNILYARPEILNIDFSIIKNRFYAFNKAGYKKNDTINIFSDIPVIIDCNKSDIIKKIDYLKSLSFSEKDIIKLTSYLPSLFVYEKDEINSKLSFFYDFDFSNDEVINIIKKIPIIFKPYYLNSLNNKFKLLLKLGFDKKIINHICLVNPYILLYSNDVLNDNFVSLCEFYKKEDVIKIISNCPIIFGYSTYSISEKLNYYKSINLLDYLCNNSYCLLYSLDFIKVRYNYVDKDLLSDLFLSDKLFFEKYKISREDIAGVI